MLILRKLYSIFFLFIFFFSSCTPPISSASSTRTPRPNATENASVANTPLPLASSLNVDKESLRGKEVQVWHPWFGAEASLFESQVAEFNTENEWGIVVRGESKGNYSELFLQTD